MSTEENMLETYTGAPVQWQNPICEKCPDYKYCLERFPDEFCKDYEVLKEPRPGLCARFRSWCERRRKEREKAYQDEQVNGATMEILESCSLSEILDIALKGVLNALPEAIREGDDERRAMIERHKEKLSEMLEEAARAERAG